MSPSYSPASRTQGHVPIIREKQPHTQTHTHTRHTNTCSSTHIYMPPVREVHHAKGLACLIFPFPFPFPFPLSRKNLGIRYIFIRTQTPVSSSFHGSSYSPKNPAGGWFYSCFIDENGSVVQLSVPDVVKCLCVLGLARRLGPASRFPMESATGPVNMGPLAEGSGGVKTLCACA